MFFLSVSVIDERDYKRYLTFESSYNFQLLIEDNFVPFIN